MLIAVASQNFRTVTGHAGKARRFIVFNAQPGHQPRDVMHIDLPKEQSMHEFKGEGRHPLDDVQVLIAGSAGAGFISRMAARGVKTVVTSETDPVTAVDNYLAGTLPGHAPHDHDECDCDHDHDHDHDHNHDHGAEGGCCCGAGGH
jgi:predicted Fe-Mo cluster-binding NifX family protein